MVVHDNHLYIYGGVLGNSFFHDVYSFDLETKTWDLIQLHQSSPLPTGRSFLASSVQNENLYELIYLLNYSIIKIYNLSNYVFV